MAYMEILGLHSLQIIASGPILAKTLDVAPSQVNVEQLLLLTPPSLFRITYRITGLNNTEVNLTRAALGQNSTRQELWTQLAAANSVNRTAITLSLFTDARPSFVTTAAPAAEPSTTVEAATDQSGFVASKDDIAYICIGGFVTIAVCLCVFTNVFVDNWRMDENPQVTHACGEREEMNQKLYEEYNRDLLAWQPGQQDRPVTKRCRSSPSLTNGNHVPSLNSQGNHVRTASFPQPAEGTNLDWAKGTPYDTEEEYAPSSCGSHQSSQCVGGEPDEKVLNGLSPAREVN